MIERVFRLIKIFQELAHSISSKMVEELHIIWAKNFRLLNSKGCLRLVRCLRGECTEVDQA